MVRFLSILLLCSQLTNCVNPNDLSATNEQLRQLEIKRLQTDSSISALVGYMNSSHRIEEQVALTYKLQSLSNEKLSNLKTIDSLKRFRLWQEQQEPYRTQSSTTNN